MDGSATGAQLFDVRPPEEGARLRSAIMTAGPEALGAPRDGAAPHALAQVEAPPDAPLGNVATVGNCADQDLSPPTFFGSAPADPLSTSNPTDLEDLSAPSLPSARPGHGTAPSAPCPAPSDRVGHAHGITPQ